MVSLDKHLTRCQLTAKAIFGLLLSLPDILITKAYTPIIGHGLSNDLSIWVVLSVVGR